MMACCALRSITIGREFDSEDLKNGISTVCSELEEVVVGPARSTKNLILNTLQKYADKITHAVDGSQDRYRVCCFTNFFCF